MTLLQRKRADTEEQREELIKLLTRTNTDLLMYAVLIFQAVCMVLLAFRDGEIHRFSLLMAVLLPAGTYFGLELIKKWWPIDRMLYILTAFLCGLGVITLRAVVTKDPNASADQAKHLAVGFCMLLAGIFAARRITGREKILPWGAVLCVGALLVPRAFSSSNGAYNWIYLGPVQFQPSEFVKVYLVVFLASGFSGGKTFRSWAFYVAGAAVFCACLVVEKDLGAMALYFALTLAMFLVGTGSLRPVLWCSALAAAACVLAINNIDRLSSIKNFGYAVTRIRIWLDPWAENLADSAMQVRQGLVSLASAGLFGSGLGLSSAENVSIVASDYIFAAIAEEFGMIFAISVLVVYLVVLLRGMRIALSARSRFHALLAFGCTFQLIFQTLFIVMGNFNLIPLSGITLPFISEGGSSLTTCMTLMGLLLGVSSVNAEDEYDDYKKNLRALQKTQTPPVRGKGRPRPNGNGRQKRKS